MRVRKFRVEGEKDHLNHLLVWVHAVIDSDEGPGHCKKQGYKASEDRLAQQVMDAESEAARLLQLLR